MDKGQLHDCLFFYGFTSCSRIFHLNMETSPLPVEGWKIRPMLGAQSLWAGKDLYRATPTVTQGLLFSGLLLRHALWCGGYILTPILTNSQLHDGSYMICMHSGWNSFLNKYECVNLGCPIRRLEMIAWSSRCFCKIRMQMAIAPFRYANQLELSLPKPVGGDWIGVTSGL
jgi:hypothetical protein